MTSFEAQWGGVVTPKHPPVATPLISSVVDAPTKAPTTGDLTLSPSDHTVICICLLL